MLTKFRRWMNFSPPVALGMDEWEEYENKFEKEAPIRYFIKYAIVSKIMLFYDIMNKLGWAIRYRTFSKYHVVDTKLAPGYHEIDSRMLYANFELLVDFVEIECANIATVFDDDARKKALGWQWRLPRLLRVKKFRNRELGMKHLEWETTLSDSNNLQEFNLGQAQRAVQIILLYIWWKDIYPKRQELEYPNTGLGDQSMRFLSIKWRKANPKIHEEISQWAKDSFQQELDWDEEDEKMLIALIKIRKGLWT